MAEIPMEIIIENETAKDDQNKRSFNSVTKPQTEMKEDIQDERRTRLNTEIEDYRNRLVEAARKGKAEFKKLLKTPNWKTISMLTDICKIPELVDVVDIEDFLIKKLKDECLNNPKQLMWEIKQGADILRNTMLQHRLDISIDIISELITEVHSESENEDVIESALVDSAKAGDNEWPLLIAAGCGFEKCVSKIWNAFGSDGIDKDDHPIYKRDLLGHNCLIKAIVKNQRGVVKVILKMENKEAIHKLMKTSFNWEGPSIFGWKYDTPLRMLIKNMPDMAKLFLDLCQKKGYDGFIDDHSWAMQSIPKKQNEPDTQSLCGNFKKLFQSNRPQPDNHVLNCIVENDRLKFLKHPLIKKWIDQKWKKAVGIYLIQFVTYFCFISFLTAYCVITPNPALSSICKNTSFDTFDVPPNSTINLNCTYQFGGAIIIITLAGLHLIFEIMQLIQRRLQYIRDKENVLQLFIFTGSIVFTSNFERHCHCIDESRWQLGAFVLLGGWLNLILQLKEMPIFGPPIDILFNICWRYIKLLYLPILLMISFALPFYMVFVINANGINSILRFSTPSWSLLSYWVGQTGDTGFSDVFLGAPLPYVPAAAILLAIFLIVVPVLFNNMLIGFAVGDTSKIQEQADLSNLAYQVRYIIYATDAFPVLFRSTYFKEMDVTNNEIKAEDTDDTVGKEDIWALEDKIMKELDDINKRLDKQLDKRLDEILRHIQSIIGGHQESGVQTDII